MKVVDNCHAAQVKQVLAPPDITLEVKLRTTDYKDESVHPLSLILFTMLNSAADVEQAKQP